MSRCPFSSRLSPPIGGLLLLLALPAPVGAEIIVATKADGRLVMTNRETPEPAPVARPRAAAPRDDILEVIERHAVRQRLDPLLVRALIEVESGYDARAVSHKGAMGLMQLMPLTAAELAVGDPFDPDANVRGGTDYLRRMLDSFDGHLPLALAGYNAGPEAVRRYGGIPPYRETRDYVRRVMRLYRGADYAGLPPTAVAPAPAPSPEGRRTYLVRRDGRLVMTTTPPDRR